MVAYILNYAMKGQVKSKKGSRPINCLNRNLIVLALPPGSSNAIKPYHDTWGWRERRRCEIRCMHAGTETTVTTDLHIYSFQTKRIMLDINKDLDYQYIFNSSVLWLRFYLTKYSR